MTLSQTNKFEDNLYCTKCWTAGGYVKKQRDAAAQWKPKESTGTVDSRFASLGGGSLQCQSETCGKTVYPAEALLYEGRHYHPLCFKCTHCANRIQSINDAQHNKKNPYCKACFKELELYRADKC